MPRNRFSLNELALWSSQGPGGPAVSDAFVVYPLLWQQAGGVPAVWQQVYQMALEQARAVVRPSRWARFYVASPN